MGSWIDIDLFLFFFLAFLGLGCGVFTFYFLVKCMGSVMGMRLWFDTPPIDGEHVESLKRVDPQVK